MKSPAGQWHAHLDSKLGKGQALMQPQRVTEYLWPVHCGAACWGAPPILIC